FADGEVVEADVVIGADGVHSIVRGAVADPELPTDSGICAFRALVPADRAPEFARRNAQTLWIGPGHHLVHSLVSAARLIPAAAVWPTTPSSREPTATTGRS